MQNDANSTILMIKKATRADSGEYSLTVKNEAGCKSTIIHCTVLDCPSVPVGPIQFEELTPEYAVISWIVPKDNGGTPITNYIVEKSLNNDQI